MVVKLCSPVSLSLCSQQRSHFQRLIKLLARDKVHMYCLLLENDSYQAAVISQVSSLPETEQRTKLVQPGLVELSWREGVTDVQVNPVQPLGQRDPDLLLGGQVVQVVAGEAGGAEGGGVQMAEDRHLYLLREVKQVGHFAKVGEHYFDHSLIISFCKERQLSPVYCSDQSQPGKMV